MIYSNMNTDDEQMMENENDRNNTCFVSKSGITLLGFHVSWVVVIIVLALVWYYQKKHNGTATQVAMIGGALDDLTFNTNYGAPSNIRRMFGHY